MTYSKHVLKTMAEVKERGDRDSALSIYALASEDDSWQNNSTNCMSDLSRVGGLIKNPTHLIVKVKRNYKGRGRLDDIGYEHPHFDQYINWLLKESAFSQYFYSKNVEEVRETGVVVIRTDMPSNLMLMVGAAVRYTWEFPEFIDNWAALCAVDIEPHKALVLMHTFHEKDGDYYEGYGNHNSNHFMFRGSTVRTLDWADKPELWHNDTLFNEYLTYTYLQDTWRDLNVGKELVCLMAFTTTTKVVKSPFVDYHEHPITGDVILQVKQVMVALENKQ